MSIALVVNGVTYDYPEVDDVDWGPEATDWAAAVTNGMLQKSGGLFQLLAEVDFGTSYGIKTLYLKSRTSNVASAGQIRLARADVINWRNEANDADLSLGVSSSNILQFNGTSLQNLISVSDTATIDLTLSSDVLSASIVAGSITNAMISASAAIAYSKLALTGSIVNADLANMAESTFKGRAASSGTGAPVDLSATQATAILNNFVGDSGSGGTKGMVPAPSAGDAAANRFLFADGTWATPPGSGDVVGPASSAAGQIARFADTSGKLLTATPSTISNSDVNASAGIAVSKLAALTASRAVVSDGSGFLSAATTTATEIGYVNGVTSAIQTQLDAKQARSTLTTKGDLYVATASATVARQGVGANGTALIADSGQTNGIRWASSTAPYAAFSSNHNVSAAESFLAGDAASAGFTFTLPTAGVAGKTYTFLKTDSSFNAITITDSVYSTVLSTINESVTVLDTGSAYITWNRSITNPTGGTSYTPTFTGFGTVSNVGFRWWRIGSSVRVMGRATCGTTTVTEARISLPSDGTTTLTVATLTGFLANVGVMGRSVSGGAGSKGGVVLVSATQAYMKFSEPSVFNSVSVDFSAPMNGSPSFASTNLIYVDALIPISGWEG